MRGISAVGVLSRGLLCAWSLLILGVGSAGALPIAHPREGKLPGFPVIRGLIPVLASRAQIAEREKLVNEGFSSARSHSLSPTGTPVPNEKPLALCSSELEEELSLVTQNMCYRGGPVVHRPTIHLIFWQGPLTGGAPNPEKFPASYISTVEHYFEDVAHDSHLFTDVFAVDQQYGEVKAGKYLEGEYAMSFEASKDVYEDIVDPLPNKCTDQSEYSKGPCLLDSDIQKEVREVAANPLEKWPTENLQNIYVVLTPPDVGSCFEASGGECAYRQYCAYHGDFGGNGMTPGFQTLYVDLPYLGRVVGCDSGVHPNESFTEGEEKKATEEGKLLDEGGDAVIDTASHEVNEAITDPIGSQCDQEEISGQLTIVGCEQNAWTDAIGQEVADKCLPPETTVAGIKGIYGLALGEMSSGNAATSYNQVINGHHYWTQREWSNEAGLFEGACVQRVIQARFTAPTGAAATVPTTFNGSSAGTPDDPIVYWVWDFGDGERVGTEVPTISHIYATAATYQVSLTAYDAFGSSAWEAASVTVGSAPAPPPSPIEPAPRTNTVTVTTPTPPILAYSVAQVAEKLGLPKSGTKLSGLGTISLGRAECPPACVVTLQLTTTVTSGKGRHRKKSSKQIGYVRMTVAEKGTGTLALQLNPTGRALLRKRHSLSVTLTVTVQGQEGGIWPIERTLHLSSSARASRRPLGASLRRVQTR